LWRKGLLRTPRQVTDAGDLAHLTDAVPSRLDRAAETTVEVDRVSDIEETGAIDWLLIEAHDKALTGELIPPLLDLVDRRLIRIIDALILVKRGEGDFDALTTSDLDTDLGALAGASSGLLSADDAAEAAATMTPNSVGLLIVYENLWSLPFAVATRKAGGQLIAQGHIPTQAILAALDALDS
jgi:hypothetical protein